MGKDSGGRPGPLDRTRVLAAAIAMIDADGVHALSMRKLGAELGVQAMTLYHYFSSRDELLDGIVQTVLDDLYTDPDLHVQTGHWQEYLYRLAYGVRRVALAHPQVFPLIATRPPAAPWVRPPLRSLRWMETFLQTLQEYGFCDDAAVEAYQAFSSFLLGHLLAGGRRPGRRCRPGRPARPWSAEPIRPARLPVAAPPGAVAVPQPRRRPIRRSARGPDRAARHRRLPLTRKVPHQGPIRDVGKGPDFPVAELRQTGQHGEGFRRLPSARRGAIRRGC